MVFKFRCLRQLGLGVVWLWRNNIENSFVGLLFSTRRFPTMDPSNLNWRDGVGNNDFVEWKFQSGNCLFRVITPEPPLYTNFFDAREDDQSVAELYSTTNAVSDWEKHLICLNTFNFAFKSHYIDFTHSRTMNSGISVWWRTLVWFTSCLSNRMHSVCW